MKRTISLKLFISQNDTNSLLQTQEAFSQGCNIVANHAKENRLWNHVALHNICYTNVRKALPQLGSQIVCNALRKVCASYKVLKIRKNQEVPKIVALEDLKNIRKSIKGNKRLRTRLHRWPWKELQSFIEYKAQSHGIVVMYVKPQYSSLTCSKCDELGKRKKHSFKCLSCGSYQHSDRNAAVNHCKLAESVVSAMAPVNVPKVAALRS